MTDRNYVNYLASWEHLIKILIEKNHKIARVYTTKEFP